MESPLRREAHGGFGERPGETEQQQRCHRAPGRLTTATNIGRMRNIPDSGHPQWLDAVHRHHAVVEDHVRASKATGLNLLPSAPWRINTAWTLLTGIARDLDVSTRLLAIADHKLLAKAEPATMRELVYPLPYRLVRHARTRWLRFDRDHPHTDAITTAWHRLAALPAVT